MGWGGGGGPSRRCLVAVRRDCQVCRWFTVAWCWRESPSNGNQGRYLSAHSLYPTFSTHTHKPREMPTKRLQKTTSSPKHVRWVRCGCLARLVRVVSTSTLKSEAFDKRTLQRDNATSLINFKVAWKSSPKFLRSHRAPPPDMEAQSFLVHLDALNGVLYMCSGKVLVKVSLVVSGPLGGSKSCIFKVSRSGASRLPFKVSFTGFWSPGDQVVEILQGVSPL